MTQRIRQLRCVVMTPVLGHWQTQQTVVVPIFTQSRMKPRLQWQGPCQPRKGRGILQGSGRRLQGQDILKQEVDTLHPQGKGIGDHCELKSREENSGTTKRRGWTLPSSLFSKSGDLPDRRCAERRLGGQRGSDVKGCSTHRPLQQNPFWLRDACTHMGGSWGTPHVDCDTRCSKMTGQGKPRKKCTLKVI